MAPTTAAQPPENLHDIRLGRIPQYDSKSLEFPMRELVRSRPRIRSRKWAVRQHLDQGQTPRCVGYSIAQEIGMQPYYHNVTTYLADILYSEAQKIDYWAGEGYDGTSNLAGLTVAKKLGFYHEFRWALAPDPMNDILRALSNIGPIQVGSFWWSGMYIPNSDGLVTPTGAKLGGHAYNLSELNWREKRVYSPNTWGDNGFWLSLDDLEKLLYDDGEAAVITRRD